MTGEECPHEADSGAHPLAPAIRTGNRIRTGPPCDVHRRVEFSAALGAAGSHVPVRRARPCPSGCSRASTARPAIQAVYLSGQDIHIADRYIELPWGHRLRLLEVPRFRARVVGSTFSLKAGRWSVALTMEFERKRQPPPPDTHAGVSLGARTLETSRDRERLPELLGSLIGLLREQGDEELTQAFRSWVAQVLLPRRFRGGESGLLPRLEEVRTMLAVRSSR